MAEKKEENNFDPDNFDADENWDWDAEGEDEFVDEVGEDFRGMDDESCKCLFTDKVMPSAQEALSEDKKQLGFDFNAMRAKLKLDFHQCIILINYIRHMVKQHKSVVDEKQFENNENLLKYMKENNQFESISLDLPFWSDEKYLIPADPSDTMLTGFDWEDDDEIDEDERVQMLEDARMEEAAATGFISQLVKQGINLNELKE